MFSEMSDAGWLLMQRCSGDVVISQRPISVQVSAAGCLPALYNTADCQTASYYNQPMLTAYN